jgi:uncharacterized membrane protein YbhN (UPF0104 family)
VRVLEGVLLIAGLVLFGLLLYDFGVATVLANMRLVGWGIVAIVLQELLAYTANTVGWFTAFPKPRPTVPFTSLLAARIAGDAVNYLTPTATFGGEFVRSRMLRGYASITSIGASLAVAKLTQTIGLVVFVALGTLTVVDYALLPVPVRVGLLVGLGVFAGALILFFLLQRRGLFTPILRLAAGRSRLAWLLSLHQTLQRLDSEIRRFHAHGHGPLLLSSAYFGLGWVLGTVETYLILVFLNVPTTVEQALAIEVLTVAFDNVFFFVPLRAGTQEASKVLAFTLFGLDPIKGMAFAMLSRVREFTWALIGLAILSCQHIWGFQRALQPREDA